MTNELKWLEARLIDLADGIIAGAEINRKEDVEVGISYVRSLNINKISMLTYNLTIVFETSAYTKSDTWVESFDVNLAGSWSNIWETLKKMTCSMTTSAIEQTWACAVAD